MERVKCPEIITGDCIEDRKSVFQACITIHNHKDTRAYFKGCVNLTAFTSLQLLHPTQEELITGNWEARFA